MKFHDLSDRNFILYKMGEVFSEEKGERNFIWSRGVVHYRDSFLILDLDNTLGCPYDIESYENMDFHCKDCLERIDKKEYVFVLRPFVRQFLEFVFRKFKRIAIWTMGLKSYAGPVIEELFYKNGYIPDFVLFREDVYQFHMKQEKNVEELLYRLPLIFDFYRKNTWWSRVKEFFGSCWGRKEGKGKWMTDKMEDWIYGSRLENTFLLDDRFQSEEGVQWPNYIPMVPFWLPDHCCNDHCRPRCDRKRWVLCKERGLKMIRDWMMKNDGIGILERLDPVFQLKTYYVDDYDIYGGQKYFMESVGYDEWKEFHVIDLDDFEL